MTSKEFWDLYTKKDITDNYEEVENFFSQDLPRDFIRKREYLDVVPEVTGQLEDNKEFDKLLRFINVLQSRQPKIYLELFEFLDIFLIDYHCYHQQYEKLQEPLNHFIQVPDRNPDVFISILHKLTYLGLLEYVAQMVAPSVFLSIDEEDEDLEELDYEISNSAYYLELEKQYLLSNSTQELNWDTLNRQLDQYDLFFDEEHFSLLKKGFSATSLSAEELNKAFPKEKEDFLLCLQAVFLRHMHKKGFSFLISSSLWDQLEEFWDEFNYNSNINDGAYFAVNLTDFSNYLNIRNRGCLLYANPEKQQPSFIWGSAYVYDFLLASGFIDEKDYRAFLASQNEAKAEFIIENISELWTFTYVHQWPKPESLSQEAFEAEKRIFKKSYGFVGEGFEKHKNAIGKELDQLGDLKKQIEVVEERNRIEEMEFFNNLSKFNIDPNENSTPPPPGPKGSKNRKK